MDGEVRPLIPEFWAKLTLLERKRRFSINIRYIAPSSAVTASQKVQLTRIGKKVHYQLSNESKYVAPPPKGGLKTQSGRFSSKILTLICDIFETIRDRMTVSINP